jgi:hypothetical protein
MKRQLHIALLPGLALLACILPATAAASQSSGEILGTNPEERTLTLRVSRPDGRESIVFHVPGETVIRREGSSETMRFEDLRAGEKAVVTSRKDEGRRIAVEIVVRHSPGEATL